MHKLGSWLSAGRDVLNHLAETVAPLVRSNLEQFQYAWRKIDEEYGQMMAQRDVNLDDPNVLYNSKMVEYLNQLVSALVKEEEEALERQNHPFQSSSSQSSSGSPKRSASGTGPCFEYLLEKDVIDKLCALGMPDRPPGMRTLITKTLDAILSHTDHPILPNMSVILSIRQFLDVCLAQGDLQARNSKGPFTTLLRTLCLKLKSDASLSGIFFDEHVENPDQEPDFVIFSALCTIINDFDYQDNSRLALEGLLYCVQLPDPTISRFIAQKTDFASALVTGLAKLFDKLPKTLESVTEELPVGDVVYDLFCERLEYIDMVAQTTFPVIGETFARLLLSDFLNPVVTPRLLHMEEGVCVCTTLYMRRMLKMVSSKVIQDAIVRCLLGDVRGPETREEETREDLLVRSTLIKRMDSLSESLTVATLGLFEVLILTRSQLVMSNLLLRNLESLHHIIPSSRNIYARSLQAQLQDVSLAVSNKQFLAPFEGLESIDRDPSFNDYMLDAHSEAHAWMQAFVETWDLGRWQNRLAELSKEGDVKADSSVKAGSDQAQGADGAISKSEADSGTDSKADSPSSAESSPSSSSSNKNNGDFYEGLFLTVLLNKFDTFYDNPFKTNLRLTSVFAKMAFCPHPLLHSYLLNPSLPVVSGVRVVSKFLAEVWSKGRIRGKRMQNFERRLEDARLRLNNENKASVGAVETMDYERFFQGLIVFEEFIKELLSISQSHRHLHNISKVAATAPAAGKPQALELKTNDTASADALESPLSSPSLLTSARLKSPSKAPQKRAIPAPGQVLSNRRQLA